MSRSWNDKWRPCPSRSSAVFYLFNLAQWLPVRPRHKMSPQLTGSRRCTAFSGCLKTSVPLITSHLFIREWFYHAYVLSESVDDMHDPACSLRRIASSIERRQWERRDSETVTLDLADSHGKINVGRTDRFLGKSWGVKTKTCLWCNGCCAVGYRQELWTEDGWSVSSGHFTF